METIRIVRTGSRRLGLVLGLVVLSSLVMSPAFAGDRLKVHRESLQKEARALAERNLRSVDSAPPANRMTSRAQAILTASTITLDSGEVEANGLEADEDCE